jgi:hypothetical protein
MKMVAEYLDTAIKFGLKRPKAQGRLRGTSRRLPQPAEKRAKEYGLAMPSDPHHIEVETNPVWSSDPRLIWLALGIAAERDRNSLGLFSHTETIRGRALTGNSLAGLTNLTTGFAGRVHPRNRDMRSRRCPSRQSSRPTPRRTRAAGGHGGPSRSRRP